MDTLPVALCELNGNTFQSTGGHTAKLLGEWGLRQAERKAWGRGPEWAKRFRGSFFGCGGVAASAYAPPQ